MVMLRAAGILALVVGGVSLWLWIEDRGDSFHLRQLWLSVAVLLSYVAHRWGLATGDQAILRRRVSKVAGVGIASGFLALTSFMLWLTVRHLLGP